MTWTLSASGHINSEPNTKEAEEALAKKLAAAFKPFVEENNLHHATFVGNFVSQNLLTPE